jgi:hypothetical protein
MSGFLETVGLIARGWSYRGGPQTPDPNRPADYSAAGGARRADRYTGHGQPRQYPDPQKLRSVNSPERRVMVAEDRPLAVAARVGQYGDRGLPADPTGTATVLSIQAMYGAGQAGELGEIRWGMAGNSYERSGYYGDLGQLQRYHGAQTVAQDMRAIGTVGNRSTFRGGILSGLPSTTGVPGLPLSPVAQVLVQTGT